MRRPNNDTAEILREQDKIARTLDTARKVYGGQDAEIRCAAMVVGVVIHDEALRFQARL